VPSARANMSLVVGQASRLSPWLKPSQQKDAEAPSKRRGDATCTTAGSRGLIPARKRTLKRPQLFRGCPVNVDSVSRPGGPADSGRGREPTVPAAASGQAPTGRRRERRAALAARLRPGYNGTHDRMGRGTLFPVPGGNDDHILKRVDKILDLSWLREEVKDCYCLDNGRPGIDPEAAVRLMLAGLFQGIIHDRRLMREAQVNLAIRWFAGYRLDEPLPHHSSLTRIRQRWGPERFKRVFQRTVAGCVEAGLVNGETVHVDATLIRADVSWASLAERHVAQVLKENESDNGPEDPKGGHGPGGGRSRSRKSRKYSTTDPDATLATGNKNAALRGSCCGVRVGGLRVGFTERGCATAGLARCGRVACRPARRFGRSGLPTATRRCCVLGGVTRRDGTRRRGTCIAVTAGGWRACMAKRRSGMG